MPKKLLKTCVVIFSICFLFLGSVSAQNEEIPDVNVENPDSQMELVQNDVKIEDPDIVPINVDEVKKTVVPDTKKEGKKVVGLFLKTMAGVILCTILIYFILLLVKKFYGNNFVNTESSDEIKNLDLSTPENKADALKTFLDKSK